MLSALGILKALLALANGIAGYIREENLMKAGEARAVAKSMAALASRLGIGREITAAVEAMSDDGLDKELRGD